MHAWFQPVFDLATREVVGHEALARIVHADGTVVPAGSFMSAAEDAGVMHELAGCVTLEAISMLAEVPDNHTVAVNASPAELSDPRFVMLVRETLDCCGVEYPRLIIEITEAGLLALHGDAQTALWQLAADGVQLYLDDFGTGYSTIASLAEHPISRLKLDRTFTSALNEAEGAVALVEGLAVLGERLGCTLVAEGIETEAQARTVAAAGWRYGQGYLFSPAVETPVTALAALEPARLPMMRGALDPSTEELPVSPMLRPPADRHR